MERGLRILMVFALVFPLGLPGRALALLPIQENAAPEPAPLLGMGTAPAPVASAPGVTGASPAAHLKDIELGPLQQPLSGDNPQQAAESAALQVISGAAAGPDRRLALGALRSGATHQFTTAFKRSSSDPSGNRHLRVGQFYKGLPIIGAEIIVHVDRDQRIYRITGKYLPDIEISVQPAITPEAALEDGLQALSGEPNLRIAEPPALVIYEGRLAYAFVLAHDGTPPGRWHYYIDAQTERLLLRYNNIQSAPPSGNGSAAELSGNRLAGEDGQTVYFPGWLDADGFYYMYHHDSLWGIFDLTDADLERYNAADWGNHDPAAVSAAVNFDIIQKYNSTVLGRDSFDDRGTIARAEVHDPNGVNNAMWDSEKFHFGDGDGKTARPMTVLDIAAHEFGHAITQYTSNLLYTAESGALNEGYSDIFAAAVEFWGQADDSASYPQTHPGKADWLLGEDSWLVRGAIRDLRNPEAFGFPSAYAGTHWYFGEADGGGIHTDSTVLSHAFYLLAVGGQGTNDGIAYSIDGIGVEKAAQVALQANINYQVLGDTYINARQAWVTAAADLSADPAIINKVFDAVNVRPDVFFRNQTVYSDFNDIAYTLPCQDYEDSNNDDIFLADDFKLARTGAVYTIRIPVYISGPNGTPATLRNASMLHFKIYNDKSGIPAGEPTGQGQAPVWSLDITPSDARVHLGPNKNDQAADLVLEMNPPVILPAGTYWLVFYPSLQFSTYGETYLFSAETENGQTAQVINPGGGLNTAMTHWTPVTAMDNTSLRDLAFAIVGHAVNTLRFTAGTGGKLSGSTIQYLRDGRNCAPVQALADAGYRFANWTGDYTGTDNPLTISTVSADMQIVANFSELDTEPASDPVPATDPAPANGGGGGGGCFISTLTR